MTMQRLQSRRGYTQLHSYEEDVNSYEESYTTNDWQQYVSPKTVSQARPTINKALQANGSRTPVGRDELYLLQKGDHIGWRRPYLIWHHAIVVETDANNRRLKVIHYTKDSESTAVKEEWIDAYQRLSGELFRFNYAENDCNTPDLVLERARSKVGQTEYHLLENNCEHLAVYCKTGITDCAQVHWLLKKIEETIGAGVAIVTKWSTKAACDICKEAAKQTLQNVGEAAVKVGAAEAFETIGKASNCVGAGLLVGIEALHCGYDIYQFYKKRKDGEMTNRDFKKTVTERVSGAVVGSGLAVGGSIFGEFVGGVIGGSLGSCIPVVGTVIGAAVGAFAGSVIGGLVGSFVGKMAGTVVGRWFASWFF